MNYLFFVLLAFVASPPAKPNFSGVWEANLERSTLRGRPVRRLLVKVEHEEPGIVQKIAATYASGEEERMTFRFETNGKESANAMGAAMARTRAHWEGEELVIETDVKAGERELRFADYWLLAADGKSLTMAHRNDALAGQVTVLEKATAEAPAKFK